jgi:hypothetical protein
MSSRQIAPRGTPRGSSFSIIKKKREYLSRRTEKQKYTLFGFSHGGTYFLYTKTTKKRKQEPSKIGVPGTQWLTH